MKAIDTNILIRFLVGEDEIQAQKVYSIFKKTESEKKELFVPLLVVLEMIWVLESVYDLSDLLIAHSAKVNGCEAVITFDKEASKLNLSRMKT
ncbi:MAG: hypothetical protein JJV92_04825 [Desulfosarcina sp.]|nr:hypothetical protein [Desulfobacterales bacterium]